MGILILMRLSTALKNKNKRYLHPLYRLVPYSTIGEFSSIYLLSEYIIHCIPSAVSDQHLFLQLKLSFAF